MNEIKSLIEKAEKYIKSSEILINAEDYESSVSRTYYAMFFSTQAVLLTKNLTFSSHKGVISNFGKHFVKTGIFPGIMGRELHLAFEKRQIGEYGYIPVISSQDAVDLLEKGKVFIENVRLYLQTQKYL
ncbi:MAG: HEPN domain-containing protein [Candidatus Eremiobacteraeota bacterium]|nr:HEPN domain-containing protein [Candidatus Eremiobacteraeota bacterium]